jgi:hypothetical protein
MMSKVGGGYRKVFAVLDEYGSGYVTSDDICSLCSKNGVCLGSGASEVVGKYLRCGSGGMRYEEFA